MYDEDDDDDLEVYDEVVTKTDDYDNIDDIVNVFGSQPPAPAAGNNPPHPLHASIGVTATGSASEDDEGSSTTSSGHHTLSHAVAMTPNAQHGRSITSSAHYFIRI